VRGDRQIQTWKWNYGGHYMFGIWVRWRDHKVFQNYDWKLMAYRVAIGVLKGPNTQLNTTEAFVQYTTEYFPWHINENTNNNSIFNNTFLELFRNIYSLRLQASHKAYSTFSFILSLDWNDNGYLPGLNKTRNIFARNVWYPVRLLCLGPPRPFSFAHVYST
jgi:hypothetical protein